MATKMRESQWQIIAGFLLFGTFCAMSDATKSNSTTSKNVSAPIKPSLRTDSGTQEQFSFTNLSAPVQLKVRTSPSGIVFSIRSGNNHQLGFDNTTTNAVRSRPKRQWGGGGYGAVGNGMCPPQCFACSPMHCQAYQCIQPQVVNLVRCCCRPAIIVQQQQDLKTACDGEEAVAACMNGLCGQGYFCNARKFCCRCQTGKSLGPCVNGLCPAGYACNSNNFCCAVGAGSVLGPCANGICPEGYECGDGELCYARSGTGWATTLAPRRRNYPPVRKSRPRWAPQPRYPGKRRRQQQKRREWYGNDDWQEQFNEDY